MLTEKQQCVFDWLNKKLNQPVFADAYKGALSLLNEKSPGYITFVSHAGRDLMNILPKEVAGVSRSRVDYHQQLDELEKEWENKWGTPLNITKSSEDRELRDGGEEERSIPYRVFQKIQKLIDKHRDSREKDHASLFFTTFLDYSDIDRIPENFLQEWKTLKGWFLKYAHLRSNFSNKVPSELIKHFKTLDELMYVAASSEFKRVKEINEILEETNH